MTKKELETAMADNILNSLDLSTNPELIWSYKKDTGDNETFERKDGLKLRSKDSNYFYIVEPVDYGRFDFYLERSILTGLNNFRIHLLNLEKKKQEEAKAKILIKFFGLDIKSQRKNKIEKINEIKK